MASVKTGAHPWFQGERVEYLLVYRQVRRGKEDRWALCSGRIAPVELVDDIGIAERYGAGYFRVQARGAGGRILGAAYHVGIPDAEGKVPVQSDDGDAAAGVVARDDGSGASGQLLAMMGEWIKLLQKQFQQEIDRSREDNRANLEAFAKINQATIESLTAIQGPAPRPADDDRFASIVKRLDAMQEENVRLRVEAAESRGKRRGGGDEEIWGDVLRMAVPKIFEVAAARASRPAPPRASGVVDRVRKAQRSGARAVEERPAVVAEDAPQEHAPDDGAEVMSGEVVELSDEECTKRLAVLGWVLPSIDDVRDTVAGGTLSPKEVQWFRVLRDAGLLPRTYRDALVSAL